MFISLKDVSLTLAGPEKTPVSILHNIDLSVNKGEIISVIGPSGSGKTSLLTLIAGLETPVSGSITIADTDITGADEDTLAAFRRDHIGIVFQNFHLIPSMTALENVAAGLELAGAADARDRAAEALARTGMSHRETHFPEQLSGGEQQRVALARAVVSRPSLLLADEPTGNLDGENGRNITELLFSLREEYGATLILVTHDNALSARAHRRYIMQDGRLREESGAEKEAANA